MEGTFEIEITGDDCDSALSAYVDDGAIRERLVPPTALPIPVRTFLAAIAEEPGLVATLHAVTKTDALVLKARSGANAVAQHYEIEEQSLDAPSRITAPPPPDFDARRSTAAARDSTSDS
jgi:hypothetical protein